ncbi:hypothetical protein MMC30_004967 [Trapelia coarctata]|nr:hypothetical protein [Trapelia coarctata]
MSQAKVIEGVFAIGKPPSITSAQVVRDLQTAFNPSKLFAPWLAIEKANRAQESRFQRNRRRDKRLQVKIGHGGTLDPLATGVLIIGVGKGTKHLQNFLSCTKSYEATLLFGAATDTYDVKGKILGKAPYAHVTQEKVEEALEGFKGKIMQRPPVYSALRIQGKRLYEYAREGKELPVEIQERPVTVEKLEIMEWLEPGSHEHRWPAEEAGQEEKEVAEKVLHIGDRNVEADPSENKTHDAQASETAKRKRLEIDDEDGLVYDTQPASKRREPDPEIVMSGGLLATETSENSQTDDLSTSSATMKSTSADLPSATSEPASLSSSPPSVPPPTAENPPAVKLRMTVTSGFYVRSLCHDLSKAVGSLGIMSELVRTRQGDFELGKNVMDYAELEKGEEVWGPKVEGMLEEWVKRVEGEGSELEEAM